MKATKKMIEGYVEKAIGQIKPIMVEPTKDTARYAEKLDQPVEFETPEGTVKGRLTLWRYPTEVEKIALKAEKADAKATAERKKAVAEAAARMIASEGIAEELAVKLAEAIVPQVKSSVTAL